MGRGVGGSPAPISDTAGSVGVPGDSDHTVTGVAGGPGLRPALTPAA